MNFKIKNKRIHGSWQRLYSRQSILCAMDRFVEAVDNMNDTILIPARLMDMSCQDEQCNELGYDNYYHCYTMINAIKNELLWGGSSDAQTIRTSSNRRRLSITSSISLSDSDADCDSVISESSMASSSSSMASSPSSLSTSLATPETVVRNLRHHLIGLNDALNRLANSAIVLTCKYQEDVGVHGQS